MAPLPEVPPGTVMAGPSRVVGLETLRWVAGPGKDDSFGEILAKSGVWVRDDSFDLSEVAKNPRVDATPWPTRAKYFAHALS